MLRTHYFLRCTLALMSTISTVIAEQDSVKPIEIKHANSCETLFAMIDGVPIFGITDRKYGRLSITKKNLLGMLNGDEKHPGYAYNGKLYTVEELTKIEKELETGISTYQERSAFKHCIEEVKADFEKTIAPLLTDAPPESLKNVALKLVKASCELHNTPNSFMLTWADAEKGNEFVLFRKELVTMHQVRTFIVDQINFLEFMLSNCPKSYKLYKAMIHKKLADRKARK